MSTTTTEVIYTKLSLLDRVKTFTLEIAPKFYTSLFQEKRHCSEVNQVLPSVAASGQAPLCSITPAAEEFTVC